MNLFQKTLRHQNHGAPPIWFMRQAGRYHSHYQKLKQKHSFLELCRNPKLAAKVTMGPIEDFDFDAAILFSDLLFPLDTMGMGLSYEPSPKLKWYLDSTTAVKKLITGSRNIVNQCEQLSFQARAIEIVRSQLPPSKALIGFVGGPFTLFSYAVVGSHQGDFNKVKNALLDDRYKVFNDHTVELLVQNMKLQTDAGLDAIAIFDTAAGECTHLEFQDHILPYLRLVIQKFNELRPNVPIIYYSKNTSFDSWKYLEKLPITALGVDWKTEITEIFKKYGENFCIQGNFNPEFLLLSRAEFEKKIAEYFSKINAFPKQLRKNWISGLGHGVLQNTPEENIRIFIRTCREIFS